MVPIGLQWILAFWTVSRRYEHVFVVSTEQNA